MSKTRVLVLIILSLVILGFVLTLLVDVESPLGKAIYGNPFVPAALFFIFFGAFAGVIKILVDLALPQRLTRDDGLLWERARANGRTRFVLHAVLFAGLPLLVIMALEIANSDRSAYVVGNITVVTLVLLGGIAAIANALWNYQESLYQKIQKKQATSIGDEGGPTSPKT